MPDHDSFNDEKGSIRSDGVELKRDQSAARPGKDKSSMFPILPYGHNNTYTIVSCGYRYDYRVRSFCTMLADGTVPGRYERSKIFRLYNSKSKEYDTELVERIKGSMDSLLVFVSRLFSVLVTP